MTATALATDTVAAAGTSTLEAGPTPAPGEYQKLGVYTDTVYTAGDPSFTALDGATAEFGMLGSATYRIEMPDDWNGDLVVWAHGFKGFGTELDVDTPPRALRSHLIDLGYAWAASSYSENGYAPGIGADDSLAVRDYFIQEHGQPGTIYLVGASMGGNVVALSLEDFPGAYDGALSICGAIGGETEIDYLVSWAHLAAFFAGTELPLDQGALAVTIALTGPVSTALGPPDMPTLAGQQFASTVKLLTGGPRPFFTEGFLDQYIANFGYILSDPGLETPTARAATNADTVYSIEPGLGITADQINNGVFRQAADPVYRNAANYPDKVPTSGKLTAPLSDPPRNGRPLRADFPGSPVSCQRKGCRHRGPPRSTRHPFRRTLRVQRRRGWPGFHRSGFLGAGWREACRRRPLGRPFEHRSRLHRSSP